MSVLRRPLDTSALADPVRRHDAKAWWRGVVKETPRYRGSTERARRIALGAGVFASLVGLLAISVGFTEELDDPSTRASDLVGMGFIVGLFLLASILCAWGWWRLWRRRPLAVVHYRLARFAAANGLVYLPGPTHAAATSPLTMRGAVTLHRVLRGPGDDGVEFANYEIRASSATVTLATFGGYVSLALPVELPHILLRSEDAPRSPLAFAGEPREAQRLSLEGDFDRYFRLYCPAGYERDALYLFSPDVMARLVDHVRGLDVEIIGDRLYLLSSRELITERADRWDALAAAVDALDDRAERWARWREERVDDVRVSSVMGHDVALSRGGVAPSGRRLRLVWGVGSLVLVGLGVIAMVALAVAGALD